MTPVGKEARRLRDEIALAQEHRFVYLKPFIVIDIGLGEYDRALDGLEEALRTMDPILFHVAVTPPFVPLFGHPRFKAILEHVPTLTSTARRSAVGV